MVRFKNRYLTVEIIPFDGKTISKEAVAFRKYDIYSAVLNITEEIHGEFGFAAIKNGLEVRCSPLYDKESDHCNPYTRTVIIRTRHGPHRLLASSLPFLSKIGNRKVQMRGIYTGASMAKCFKYLEKFHRESLEQDLKNCKTTEEKKDIEEILSKLCCLRGKSK
nr:EOG090X0GYO [Ilyocryptus agilis]